MPGRTDDVTPPRPRAYHPPPDPEKRREIQRALDHRNLDPIRNPDRVETLAVEDLLQGRHRQAPPASILVKTDLPGRFALASADEDKRDRARAAFGPR